MPHRALFIALLVAGLAVSSVDGEELRLPAEMHEVLDPLSAIQEEESESMASQAAVAATEDAQRRMHESQSEGSSVGEVYDGGSAVQEQTDDLFGDMRRQQEKEESQEEMERRNQEIFGSKTESDARLARDDQLGEPAVDPDKTLGEGVGATVTTTVSQPTLLASPETAIQPGVDELQSYTTGYVTEEVQVGSQNGILADDQHGFTPKGSVSKGRVVLYGKKSGLYLDADGDDNAWSVFSDADKESGGICLMTAYNNEVKGLKACHTDQATGTWASGNVGITGNLMLEGSDSVIDVQRLHLHQTNMNHNGYVLKVGNEAKLKGPGLAAGCSDKAAWMQVTENKHLLLQPGKGNVGFGTSTPADKMHVAGTMAANNVFVGHTTAILSPNQFTLKSGTGWKMEDKDWLRVIGDKGIEAQAGAYFTDKVGINFNWKTMPSQAKMRINDGKIAVTRLLTTLKGVAFFYDDVLAEGRVYAKDFEKTGVKAWIPMRWEADAIIFNPDGKNPIAIGTRTPKDKYLVHIEGNNKVDGHIYVAKKMKVGGKAHVANMHTPRLNVKDQRGLDGSGQEPADNVMEFVMGEWEMRGETYEMKPGGTNIRLGYWKDYCWIQMWPTGRSTGSHLVLNGAGNRVGFGTTRPLTNVPGSGSSLLFHVDGNMLVTGDLVVAGSGSTAMLESETLLDVGFDESAVTLHQLNPRKPKQGVTKFGGTRLHEDAISLSHVAATLTRSLQHHQAALKEHDELLTQHESRLAKLDTALLARSA